MGKINLLSSCLSSRIAAGEVIDRPQAILREFLDNAIDSSASEISVTIDGGGIDRVKVKDNGSGISRDDILLIASPHATSKIKDEDDLYHIHTLGFRGEALYSIQSVSKLTISSTERETGEKSTIVIDNGVRGKIIPTGPEEGTEVTSENLFFDIPARRSFLKRSSTEALMCKNLFISKALAFPNISFTLTIDGAKKLYWPRVNCLKERVMALYREYSIFSSDVYSLSVKEDEYSIDVIATSSAVKRSDKKEIRIYVNNRAVEEFSLVQAVLYGYGELLPGGSYPYCCVFINDNPELVDFNIHPAKREVKIRNLSEIHHSISSLLKGGIERKIPEVTLDNEFYLFDDSATRFENEVKREPYLKKAPPSLSFVNLNRERATFSQSVKKDTSWLEKAKEFKRAQEEEKKNLDSTTSIEENGEEIRYIGQAFKLFLICEKGDEIYLIDQHAAHERILYDELLSNETIQKLIVPIEIEVDDDTDSFLFKNAYVYTKLGIMLSQKSKGEWVIDAIPAMCKGIEDKIIDFVTTAKCDEHHLEEMLFATMACKKAIKMGDDVDKWTAEEIIKKVFMMDEPCCPHGRTFLIKLKKENLMKMVGRSI